MSDFPFAGPPSVSFEFFPPKTPRGWGLLDQRIDELFPLDPSFVSVTYGAGGTTQERTHELVERLAHETPLDPVPHLTCVGQSKVDIDRILERYVEAGVRSILALRGDPPIDGSPAPIGEFTHAADLVNHLRNFADRNRWELSIGVAGFPEGHPDTPDTLLAMEHLAAKVDAGADWICTQLFFDNHAFHDWRDRCQLSGIRVPIIAGIMPIASRSGVKRMAQLAAGAVFPASLLRAVSRAEEDDDDAVAQIGVHWATEQCRDLLDHAVDGLHFYTLNKSNATLQIHRALGVRTSRQLRSV
ncbi:MAG: methylenetetrahydrofolate reductase [NAD(P)H] [Phycisphaerae bacterium]|nr:methylenetetrahydrofolate reductase [NAD(P)H] [Phycisphaerae bacterium]